MKTIENGCYKYVPTKEIEVSQNKRVYKTYFLGEFVGYSIKMKARQLSRGVERNIGFCFKPCKKAYQDENGKMKFILC